MNSEIMKSTTSRKVMKLINARLYIRYFCNLKNSRSSLEEIMHFDLMFKNSSVFNYENKAVYLHKIGNLCSFEYVKKNCSIIKKPIFFSVV